MRYYKILIEDKWYYVSAMNKTMARQIAENEKLRVKGDIIQITKDEYERSEENEHI